MGEAARQGNLRNCVVGLGKQALRALDTAALKATILNNVDVLPALSGAVVTGGRLNVDKALRACAPTTTPTAPSAPGSLVVR